MAQTKAPFQTDNIGNPEPITTVGNARSVYVRECPQVPTDNFTPTKDFVIYAPTLSDPGRQYSAGAQAKIALPYDKSYKAGVTVAYISTISGTMWVSQSENLE